MSTEAEWRDTKLWSLSFKSPIEKLWRWDKQNWNTCLQNLILCCGCKQKLKNWFWPNSTKYNLLVENEILTKWKNKKPVESVSLEDTGQLRCCSWQEQIDILAGVLQLGQRATIVLFLFQCRSIVPSLFETPFWGSISLRLCGPF